MSYIHHTKEFRQCCHVGNTAQHCPLALFQDSDFAGDPEDSKSTSVESSLFSEVERRRQYPTVLQVQKLFVGCWFKAGLRMDGQPALVLWNVTIELLRSSKSTESSTHGAPKKCSRNHKSKPKPKRNRDVEQLSHVTKSPVNAHSSQGESQLYIFVDNEAVPTRRHVPRTHRVAHDWFFLTESIWTPISKSNTLTPRTNSRTC